MAWLLLLPAAALFALGSLFSYRPELRDGRWFLPAYLGASTGCALLWWQATRALAQSDKILAFSLAWDLLMAATYYVLPLLALGVRLDRVGWLGVGLALTGLVLVKSRC